MVEISAALTGWGYYRNCFPPCVRLTVCLLAPDSTHLYYLLRTAWSCRGDAYYYYVVPTPGLCATQEGGSSSRGRTAWEAMSVWGAGARAGHISVVLASRKPIPEQCEKACVSRPGGAIARRDDVRNMATGGILAPDRAGVRNGRRSRDLGAQIPRDQLVMAMQRPSLPTVPGQ